MQPIIQTIGLTKNYKDFWGRGHVRALDALDLDVRRGEVFGLLGPNGSGKTTTVKLLLGLLFPTRGVVRVFGSDPRAVDVKERIGYMPEESHLYDYLDARETLDFFGRLFGLSRPERRRRTEALIDMVGLGRARNRAIGEFSKGMARRIGLAQALINDPDLLILDEPTTGLDPIGSREMKELLVTLKERGKTIFLCSHLLSDVEQVCDRISILYGGKLRTCGRVSELLSEDGRMQVRVPPLPPEGLKELKETIRKYVPGDESVEIGASERRLEDFFLAVVEQAKKERVTTAGAESGTGAAEFLTAGTRADSPEKIIEHLTEAGKKRVEKPEKEEGQEAPAVPPEEGEGEDVELIEQLSGKKETKEKDEREEEEGGPEPEPEAAREAGVRHDLLEDLVEKGKKRKKEDDDEKERSEG